MTCPELIVLSQLADDELAGDEAASVRGHVSGCPACGARTARLRSALGALAGAARAARPAEAATGRHPDCLTPTDVARWVDATAPAAERAVAARHVEHCDACLGEVMAARRLLARLDALPSLPVPPALKTRVASLWPAVAEPESTLSRIVVRVARGGAALVERHLLEPLRDLVEVPMPAPATRGATAAGALRFRLRAPSATIDATVHPSGDGVGLVLVIEGEAGDVLADQRVFLRRRGRSVYSARTDPAGTVRTPTLERAVYEVACPGIGTAFRLDLRG